MSRLQCGWVSYLNHQLQNKRRLQLRSIFNCFICVLNRGTQWLLTWQNFRRFYLYVMTENVKGIIRKHRHVLLSDDVKKKHQINEFDISTAATLPDLDEAYTRRIHNFASVLDLYHWSSSLNYLTHIQKPMVFINAKDDPLVPEALLEPIKAHARKSQRTHKRLYSDA